MAPSCWALATYKGSPLQSWPAMTAPGGTWPDEASTHRLFPTGAEATPGYPGGVLYRAEATGAEGGTEIVYDKLETQITLRYNKALLIESHNKAEILVNWSRY